jgi:phosphomannomutase/phosphoglucomutase
MALLPKEIFKAYDIRGIVGKTLTPEFVEIIGRAIGSEAIDRKQTEICVGFDGRLSGPELSNALIKGILKTGIHVINLGMV